VAIPAHEDKGSMGKFCAGDFMPEEEKCAKVLRELRWWKGVECPYCLFKHVVKNGGFKDRSQGIHLRCKRDLISGRLAKKLVGKLKGEVEIDETYVSAGQKGTNCTYGAPRKRGLKLRGRGTYDKDKPPIVALVEQDRGAVLSVAEEAGTSSSNSWMNTWRREARLTRTTFRCTISSKAMSITS